MNHWKRYKAGLDINACLGQVATSDSVGQVATSDSVGQVATSDSVGQVATSDSVGQVATSDSVGQYIILDTSPTDKFGLLQYKTCTIHFNKKTLKVLTC